MTPTKNIRVLLVEDSAVAMMMLKRMIDVPGIDVVGTARDGVEGLGLVEKLRPDVICTDLHMPRMDGLQLTHEVMSRWPTPILVVSCSVQDDDPQNIFKLLEAGAIDVLPKPRGGLQQLEMKSKELIAKIRVLSGVHPIRRRHSGFSKPAAAPEISDIPKLRQKDRVAPRIIAIGASTGGPIALETILSQLPRNFPLPMLCVQHISDGFLVELVRWLSGRSKLQMKVAATGDLPVPGTVYFAPDNANMKIDKIGRIRIDSAPAISIYRPSIDTTFSSVACYYGSEAVGVLLTGMGSDGASGLLDIRDAGGITLAQDEASSVVFGMPKVAIDRGAAQYVLALEQFAPSLLEVANGNGHRYSGMRP